MSAHILVIDDDGFNLEVLGRMLTVEGASYTAIQDPNLIASTVDKLAKVDAVFLDLEMPKMDGYKAFELLKSKLGNAVPIIACTVHLNEIDTARDLGFAGFLGKPLDKARFTHQFNRILNHQPVWDVD